MVEPTQLKNMRTSNWIIRPGRDEIIKIYELPPTSKPFQRAPFLPTAQLHQLITSSHQLTLCPVPYRVLSLQDLSQQLFCLSWHPGVLRKHLAFKTAGLKHRGGKSCQLLCSIQAILVYVYIIYIYKFLLGPKQMRTQVCGRLKISRLANLTFFTYDTWMVFYLYLYWTCK